MQKYMLKSSKVVSKALLVLHVLLVPHAWGAERMNLNIMFYQYFLQIPLISYKCINGMFLIQNW